LPDAAVLEVREKVRVAIKNSVILKTLALETLDEDTLVRVTQLLTTLLLTNSR
jgi:archaellum biogenesis ATPase FlaH